MSDYPLNIGEAAAATRLSAKMIRRYEAMGLIPAAARSDAGYRRYSERDVALLAFIRQSRNMGFSLKQIAALLALWENPARASREVRRLAQQHIDDLTHRIEEMAQMKASLEQMVAQCHGDDSPECAILEGLSENPAPAPRTRLSASPRGRARRAGA